METPQDGPYHDPLARAYWLYERRFFARALEDCLQRAGVDPEDARAYLLASACHQQLGNFGAALDMAYEALRQEPDLAEAHYTLAVRLLEREDLAKAATAAAETLALDPHHVGAHHVQSQLAGRRGRWQEALAAADQALAIAPTHLASLDARVLALDQLGRVQEARETLKMALAEHPEEPYFHARKGWLALESGAVTEALESFSEALRLDPNLGYARDGMLEALRARYTIYRWIFRVRTFDRRASRVAVIGVIVALVLGLRYSLEVLPREAGNMAVTVSVVGVLVIAGINTLADPVFNVLLCSHPYGRVLLLPHEQAGARTIGAMLAAFAILVLAACAVGTGQSGLWLTLFFLAAADFCLLWPVADAFSTYDDGERRFKQRLTALVAADALLCPFVFNINVELACVMLGAFAAGLYLTFTLPQARRIWSAFAVRVRRVPRP